MSPTPRVRWLGCLSVSLAGLLALAVTLTLPSAQGELHVAAPIRVAMACAGVVLLVVATRASPLGGVAGATTLLGVFVLAYPSLLGLAASRPLDPVAAMAGTVGHVPPLVLLQLIPVLAVTAAIGRRHRRWETAVLATAAASIACTAVSTAPVPASGTLGTAGTVLWFGSVVVAPIATWWSVRGTGGERRRRSVLAALAAMVPVVVIGWCLALGAMAEGFGLGEGWSVSLLMLGLSGGAVLCGVLALGAVAHSTALSRTRVLVIMLDALLGSLALAVGCLTVFLVELTDTPPTLAVALGAGVTVVVGLLWMLAHSVMTRFVDPGSELRQELAALGDLKEGQHREGARHVLRRLSGDRGLELRYLVASATWVGDGPVGRGDRVETPLMHRPDGTPCVLALAEPARTRRLTALGDLSAVLRPALFEAQLEYEQERVGKAAAAERQRLSRNLHDGLQGRLIGLALNLQLSGSGLRDPSARLLIEETVDSLRSVVEEVRRLGGGRLPVQLTTDGLGPALRTLLAPIRTRVDLEVPEGRLPAGVEETAYFVIGEAVTNALKHARDSRVVVRVGVPLDAGVSITVRDDGPGGADPRAGSGLRHLSERVAAAGGVFTVHDAERGGTVVEAVLPCGS